MKEKGISCAGTKPPTKKTLVSPARKWYIVQLDNDDKYIFLARELSYVYQGHAIFYDVVMSDLRAKVYYIPVERIVHVVEDAEGELIDEAKERINI